MRYLMTFTALAALMIATPGARADDVPTLNVDQLCHGIAGPDGGRRAVRRL
jgi:hypothetical protein